MKKQKITRRGAVLTRPASKKYRNKKGITLISLVVTIIILLILAGVTLALISGSDGILGRASHALDENKIAMAKEQVELALSDFQTEFFEGKYVVRTNNGTKKEYISEKLQAGLETTNFYAKASVEGNVVVYEGKDSSGTEVVKGAIQEDASIQWDNTTNGSFGSNHPGEIGDSSEGGTGSEQTDKPYNDLKAQIEQMQGTIGQLNQKIVSLEQKDTSLQTAIDNMNAAGALTFTQLATTASTAATNRVTLKDNLSNYNYVMVISGGANGFVPSGMIGMEQFKNSGGYLFATTTTSYSGAKYVNNTTCQLYSMNSGTTAELYGIK